MERKKNVKYRVIDSDGWCHGVRLSSVQAFILKRAIETHNECLGELDHPGFRMGVRFRVEAI